MKLILPVSNERTFIARMFYGYVLFIFLVECLNDRMIHDLLQPVLINPGSDNFYWLLHLLSVPQAIAGSAGITFSFEITLVVIIVFCIVFPQRNFLSICFTIVFSFYIVTKNSFVAHHEHGLTVPLMMSFIFWTKSTGRFILLFKAFRYYILFVFVSAALWKILRGSVFLPEQFSEISKTQHFRQLAFYPHTTFSQLMSWLIEHPYVSRWCLIGGTLLQFSFVAGFFTYRFDPVLFVFFFLFFIGDYLLMNLSFYQWYMASIVFMPWQCFGIKQGNFKFISLKYKM